MLSLPDYKEKQFLFAFVKDREKFTFKNDNLIIKKDNQIKHQISCHKLFCLFIVGDFTLTSGLLRRAKKFGFSIIFLNYGMRVYGAWNSKTEGNVLLRRKQYNYDGFPLARHLVKNKISNQRNALQKIRNKDTKLHDAIRTLDTYYQRVLTATDYKTLLGLEGVSARLYFSRIFNNTEWNGRQPRVKADITNLLLDIGYTKLFNLVEALLNLYGFDLYVGVLHQEFYQRKSLVCDLVEPFRPLIDQRIRKAYQLKQIHPDDFYFSKNRYSIIGKKAQPYLSFLVNSILDKKDELFLYIQKYYRSFMRNKKIEEYPWFNGEKTC